MAKYTAERIAQLLAEARASAVLPVALPVHTTLDSFIKETSNETELEIQTASQVPSVFGPDFSESTTAAIALQQSPSAVLAEHQDPHRRILGVSRDDITYNALQQEFIDRAAAGEDVVLVGAAGTGKTTCQRGLGKKLIFEGKIRPLSRSTKWLKSGIPGVAVVSFTNKAVNNIRHALPDDIKPHALTIHKLLEFAPVWYEIDDEANPGKTRKTVRFEPQRNRYNPLPSDLKLIIVEESSMVDVPLFSMLEDACPHKPQFIFLGDIQQLPPVFGSSILGFKMLELPVIQLLEVYRQARNSPIIDLAWKLLEGNASIFNSKSTTVQKEIKGKKVSRIEIPALKQLTRENEDGTVVFQPWQKQLTADSGLLTLTKQFCEWADTGYYNPDDDIILCPFNVSFGTIELNRGISQHLGRKRRAIVYEIIAGYEKHYLAEGDRVLYQKEDAFITRIVRNGEYLGKSVQQQSIYLDRWGALRTEDMDADALVQSKAAKEGSDDFDLESIEKFIEAAASDDDERVTAASHIITVKIAATGEEEELQQASEVNNLLGGYCITVHKAQGSEWDKVFLALHHTHATMNQRELLYTAVTRAKKHLHIICEPSTFEKGIASQKIKGNSLAEKAEFFKGKVEERDKMLAAKAKLKENDPINTAFAKVPEWDSLARDAIIHWWKIAMKFYPEIFTTETRRMYPTLTWKIKGSAAGYANVLLKEIGLSPVYLHLDPADMISDTIPHEVAHIVAYLGWKERGHGGMWKRVMEKFGKNPVESHYHKLGDLPAALRKLMDDSAKETGQHPDEEV